MVHVVDASRICISVSGVQDGSLAQFYGFLYGEVVSVIATRQQMVAQYKLKNAVCC